MGLGLCHSPRLAQGWRVWAGMRGELGMEQVEEELSFGGTPPG